MEGRDQWRTLTSGRHIAAPEVGHYRDSGDLRQPIGVTNL
jgi:hypothetical protein